MDSPNSKDLPLSDVSAHAATMSDSVTPRATLVTSQSGARARYDMFRLHELTHEGAVLECALMLELDEDLAVELDLDGESPLRIRAQVARLLPDLPGIEVVFPDLGEHERKRIQHRTADAADT
ncbi:hypothetical protein [Haliangium ochraceum]|uniref:PilZ domain-containing protein n=1 Tax=Haliangium ochraceum (strain DSM 14365 / JCM 11303 / SMP-2) TaxID=502025 RepID=D0LUB1_HALO1|nr:hypothetical protein [Haliangium ochraceum]ACY19234.1 hypothetical protein Hoch_6770 [Haliangium ochraceum DSM 14365]